MKDTRILIAGTIISNLTYIKKILNSNDYDNLTIINNKTVFKTIKKNIFDLIIFEITLGVIEIIEICKFIRQDLENLNTRILIYGNESNSCNKKQVFEAGANDFIIKSTDVMEFVARVKLHINQGHIYKNLTESNLRMIAELNEAKNMLEDLLPLTECLNEISKKYKIDFASYYKPSSELGGDFFDTIVLKDNKIITYLWDFSGHGISAAINTFRLHSIVGKDHEKIKYDPGAFLTYLNKILHSILPIQNFATMFYCVIDLNLNNLDYSCASCPPPILISFKNNKGIVIDSKQFPLSVKENNIYSTKSINLNDWDALILYSDALIETQMADGVYLTCEQIIDLILNIKLKRSNISAKVIKDIIISKFKKDYFDNLKDDLTLEIINFK